MDRTNHSQVYSQYHPNQSLFDSHYTRVSNPQEQTDNWFSEQRAYSRSVLAGWGLPLGQLPYSHDNEQTLRCLVELIGFRQKQLQYRGKVKEDFAAINFQKQKYRSFMQQAQRNLEDCMRKLGRTENESSELKNKSRRSEVQGKKERDDDRKMIVMLRTKNQQILHQIKKKQQQVNRVKEQMKKSVGQKTHSQAKNSFQVFEALSPLKRETVQKQQVKYNFLLERNEKEMVQLVRETKILKDKLFEVREHLLDFNEWVDSQLFGEKDDDKFKRKTRFPLNHNLLFKKESLSDQFAQLLQTARDGILQLKCFYKGGQPSPATKKTRSSQLLPPKIQMFQHNFKKKGSRPQVMRTDRSKPQLRQSRDKKTPKNRINEHLFVDNVSPRSKKTIPVPKFQGSRPGKNLNKAFEGNVDGETKSHKSSVSLSEQQLPFEDQLLSDVIDSNDQDNSIVSHIEVSKLGKNRFEKWDILYQEEDQQ